MKKIILTLAFAAMAVLGLQAQGTPAGVWKTVDDETGEAKSYVEIFEENGAYHGKISKLLHSAQDETCTECPGKKKGQKLVGMRILEGLKAYGDHWKKGTILDPESGNEYGCSVWFEEGKPDELKVRGVHWTGLYRTQTWYRAE